MKIVRTPTRAEGGITPEEKAALDKVAAEWIGVAMRTDPKFTAAEKLDAIKRELTMRRSVYPRLIEQGRMRHETADRQIAVMEAIAQDYREQVEGRRLL